MNATDNLEKFFAFLSVLRKHRIPYTLTQVAEDQLMASYALPGVRYEVYFDANDVTYSVFKGNEDVFGDIETLAAEIEAYRADDEASAFPVPPASETR